jgi:hypothetical protein
MRHKHADLIIAWAEGAEIERNHHPGVWVAVRRPDWDEHSEYRIKPEKKPDIIRQFCINEFGIDNFKTVANVRFTFDGETMKLIKSEVI